MDSPSVQSTGTTTLTCLGHFGTLILNDFPADAPWGTVAVYIKLGMCGLVSGISSPGALPGGTVRVRVSNFSSTTGGLVLGNKKKQGKFDARGWGNEGVGQRNTNKKDIETHIERAVAKHRSLTL